MTTPRRSLLALVMVAAGWGWSSRSASWSSSSPRWARRSRGSVWR